MREAVRPLPPYTTEIAVLVQAILERPSIASRMPWYIELLQMAAILRQNDLVGALADAGESGTVTERCFRLIREILGFLVQQSGLARGYLSAFDELMAPSPSRAADQTRLTMDMSRAK